MSLNPNTINQWFEKALSSATIFTLSIGTDSKALDKTGYPHKGPVVQSVVSLTSSLRAISLTVLVDSIHNILIFFAEKM